jgi:hypothetical protein
VILLGCLLAFGLAVAPRLFLILAWLFSDRWDIVWRGDWFVPLLGIIFLPFTTVMYMLVWTPAGVQGWDWLWIILGLFLDFTHYATSAQNRNQARGYVTASGAVGGSGHSSTGTPLSPSVTPASPATLPPPAATTPTEVVTTPPATAASSGSWTTEAPARQTPDSGEPEAPSSGPSSGPQQR